MVKRGRMKYLPANIFDELEQVKNQKGSNRDADALRDMATYSKLGRELERIFYLGSPPRKRKGVK
jgi:hypothetical protein